MDDVIEERAFDEKPVQQVPALLFQREVVRARADVPGLGGCDRFSRSDHRYAAGITWRERHPVRGRVVGGMTPDDVRERLEAIRAERDDPEVAHGDEDDLYRAVLQSIAEGSCDDPAETARVALHARDIDFARWYA